MYPQNCRHNINVLIFQVGQVSLHLLAPEALLMLVDWNKVVATLSSPSLQLRLVVLLLVLLLVLVVGVLVGPCQDWRPDKLRYFTDVLQDREL